MFDSHLRPMIERTLKNSAKTLAARGFSASFLTGVGFGAGVVSAACVAFGLFPLALLFGFASRLLDGLDGMVARVNGPTALGGYLDIMADFTFYALLPLGFILYDPAQNAVAGAFLLASFFINASSFLGFAILAEKHGQSTSINGEKSHFHSTGLIEGSETIAFFAVCMIWPALFPLLALGFAALTTTTVVLRIRLALRALPLDQSQSSAENP